MVLAHLPPLHALRLATVSSSWHSAVRTAHVWRELKFTSGRVCARLLNEHLGRLCISFGTAVRRAELHGLQLVTNRGVEMLLQWCPHLRALSIRSCPHVTPEVVGLCAEHVREDFEEFRLKAKWTNALSLRVLGQEWMAGVQKLVTKCGPRLRVLALEMQVSMIDVAAVVQHIAQQCGPRLQELSLDEMADSGMELLARHCPNLETVNCTTGIQCGDTSAFASICENAASLRSLCYLSIPYEHLPQLTATAVFTRLETLELDGSDDSCQDGDEDDDRDKLTPATMLSDLFGRFPHLTNLGLTNYSLPATFFSASSLSATATGLTSLNLEGSSLAKVDVEAIGREMPHLEEIKVMQSTFDDELVQAFCRGHDRQRSRLRVFRVDGTEVSADGVKMLVDACPRLESVGTYGPHLTTDEKLADLASARWSTLNLTFWRGAAVTSQGVQRFFALGGGREVRTVVVLGPAIALDEASLAALLDHCPRLELLRVTSIGAVDDACLATLAHRAPPSLAHVQLVACAVTEECARETATRVPFVLDVRFTSRAHKAM